MLLGLIHSQVYEVISFHIRLTAFLGNYSFWASGTPLTTSAVLRATKLVPNPNSTEVAAGRTSVYDTWMKTFPSKEGYNRPKYDSPLLFS